jgi:hypothetical protein
MKLSTKNTFGFKEQQSVALVLISRGKLPKTIGRNIIFTIIIEKSKFWPISINEKKSKSKIQLLAEMP